MEGAEWTPDELADFYHVLQKERGRDDEAFTRIASSLARPRPWNAVRNLYLRCVAARVGAVALARETLPETLGTSTFSRSA